MLARLQYAPSQDYELLGTTKPPPSQEYARRHVNLEPWKWQASSQEYELLHPARAPPSQGYVGRHVEPKPWKALVKFIWENSWMLVSLGLGLSGAIACFGFTYWLSQQIFYCPAWTMRCHVNHSVHVLSSRLGLVQGILSSIYGICIAMMAYAGYQLAETTLWPALTEHSFTLNGIDRFLAHARGSLAQFPFALWHARRPKHIVVVLIIAVVGILLQINATILGWAYTIVPVQTTLLSNHTSGGGMGFGFYQQNPPGPMPGEPALAYAIYSGWSNQQSVEMLPNLRDYLVDRTNLSSIGNFSVNAIKAEKNIMCYGTPLDFNNDTDYYLDQGDEVFTVPTHFKSDEVEWGLGPNSDYVLLRFQPGILTVWVDNYWSLSNNRAVTKLMFAVVNGTIEGGQQNIVTPGMTNVSLATYGYDCTGISALACEVDINLVESLACNGKCTPNNQALTSLGGPHPTSVRGQSVDLYPLAISLGAIPSMMGPNVFGAQPMYALMPNLPNSSYFLPSAYSDVVSAGNIQHWT